MSNPGVPASCDMTPKDCVSAIGYANARCISRHSRPPGPGRLAVATRRAYHRRRSEGQGDVKLSREEFERRLRERFYDPAFDAVERQIADIVEVAWKAYDEYRKSPRKRKAGPGFADPDFELPVEWLEARERIQRGRARARRTPAAAAAFCWSAARRATIRPARARCRRPFVSRQLAREEIERAGLRVRPARPEPAHRAVRPPDPSVQGLRLDGDAALPLAVLLLSESRDGPGRSTG